MDYPVQIAQRVELSPWAQYLLEYNAFQGTSELLKRLGSEQAWHEPIEQHVFM